MLVSYGLAPRAARGRLRKYKPVSAHLLLKESAHLLLEENLRSHYLPTL